MSEITSKKAVPYVTSVEEIEDVLKTLREKRFPNMTEQEYLDFATRILYFFERADEMKLTPETDKSLRDEVDHNKLITVPVKTNNYIDFQKGDFVPVCRVKKRSNEKAFENDILISMDKKSGVIWARVTTQKLIYGNKNKSSIVGSETFCVANYCIPNLGELIRAKNSDIIGKAKSVKPLSGDVSHGFEAYKRQIAKGVLQVCRLDLDVVHQNEFEKINGYNQAQKRLLKEYFTKSAEPPHFHFIYRDYVLYYKKHDGSALAINSNDMTKYLIDLYNTNSSSQDEILDYSFGMPFIDIKKRNANLTGSTSKKLLAGLTNIFNGLSEDGSEKLIETIKRDILLKVRNVDKLKNKDEFNRFQKSIDKLLSFASGKTEPDEYEKFNALLIFILQTSAIDQVYNLSQVNVSLKSEIQNIANNFYDTIEYCLSPSLHEKENNRNSYYNPNSFE